MLPHHHLLDSLLPLSENAYKSILFRAASILVQFTILHLFSYLASRRNDFTAYLMFAESIPQKLLYAFSRGLHFRSSGFIVLLFLAVLAASEFYDTMLWALDSPGYVLRAKTAPAATLNSKLREDPAYFLQYSGRPGAVSSLDLKRELGAGLWETGTNASLVGVVALGATETAARANWNINAYLKPGPRIWLDEDGFSVAIDRDFGITASNGCAARYPDMNTTAWSCGYEFDEDNRHATDYFTTVFAVPTVWWETGGMVDYWQVTPERGVSSWGVLGQGGDTVVMKQVVTVTKGRRRHVFLVSAMKATILAMEGVGEMDMSEVEDLVGRMWTHDGGNRSAVVEGIASAIRNDSGLTMGKQVTDGITLHSRVYNWLSIRRSYSAFQILDSNITLVHSETLDREIEPFEECDKWYINVATGGKVRSSSCAMEKKNSMKIGRLMGQVDTSAAFVLYDTMGARRASTSATALNETAWQWLQSNNEYIDRLILSRGYMLGVSSDAVTIELTHNVPAISILQLIFVALPFVVAAVVYLFVVFKVPNHYQSSLLANLVSTTHLRSGSADDCKSPGYMWEPPEIGLVRLGEHVALGTQTGVFRHERSEGVSTGDEQTGMPGYYSMEGGKGGL